MVDVIIGQILGICSPIITACSYQVNTKKILLLLQTLATAFTCISYLFLDANSGFVLNIACLARNIFLFFSKPRTPFCYVGTGIFMVVMAIAGFLSWEGYISLLIIIALIVNTFFLSLGNAQILRYSILITSSLIFLYNLYFLSIGGMINEAIAVTSSIVGIVVFVLRVKRRSNKEKDEKEAPLENNEINLN